MFQITDESKLERFAVNDINQSITKLSTDTRILFDTNLSLSIEAYAFSLMNEWIQTSFKRNGTSSV